MQTGIIGLPQVGKTTLFRILTKAHVDPAKGGQETRVGVAKVPEPRRVLDDPSVPQVEGTVDPLRDVTNLELELILSDLEQIEKRLERLEKDLKKKADKQFELEKVVLEKCKAHLEAEKPLRELPLTPEERKPIGGFLFLSQRPMLYVLNLGDEEAGELETAVERHKLGALQGRPNTAVVAVCGRLEAELAEMNDAEAAELLASYGLKEPGLN